MPMGHDHAHAHGIAIENGSVNSQSHSLIQSQSKT